MKINNQSVRGLWKYDPGLIFEYGDLILLEDQIYICKSPDGVSGVKPGTANGKKYFKMYPGDIVSSIDEYYEAVRNPEEAEDRYISSRVLNEILQNAYFGIGRDGMITSKVDYIDETVTLVGQINSIGTTENVLDAILTNPYLNNGSVMISKQLPELKDIIISMESLSASYVSSNKPNNTDTGVWYGSYVVCRGTITLEDPMQGDNITEVSIYNKSLGITAHPDSDGKFSIPSNPGHTLEISLPEYITVVKVIKKSFDINVTLKRSNGNDEESRIAENIEFDEDEYVMLRQYTYQSSATGYIHRIQELVDPTYGELRFRHAIKRDDSWTIDSSDWQRCVTDEGKSINDVLAKLDRYIKRKSAELNSENSDFCFRELKQGAGEEGDYEIKASTANRSTGVDLGIPESIAENSKYITISFRVKEDQGRFYNYSTSIGLKQSRESSRTNPDIYFLGNGEKNDSVRGSVYYSQSDSQYVLKIESTVNGNIVPGDVDLYYRKHKKISTEDE